MEFYPAELTSPPVPLVALIGKQELHVSIGDFLRTQNVPRVHSIGIQDAHSAAGTFGEGRQPAAAAAAAEGRLLPASTPGSGYSTLTTPLPGSCRLQEGGKQQQPTSGHSEGWLAAETPHRSPRRGGGACRSRGG